MSPQPQRALFSPWVSEITLINAALASVCLILEAASSSPAFPTQLLLFEYTAGVCWVDANSWQHEHKLEGKRSVQKYVLCRHRQLLNCLLFVIFSINVPLLLCREIKIPVDKCVGVNVLVEMEYIVPQFAAGAFPGGSVVESACQGSSHGFDSWSGKMPHATEQLSPGATTTESVL